MAWEFLNSLGNYQFSKFINTYSGAFLENYPKYYSINIPNPRPSIANVLSSQSPFSQTFCPEPVYPAPETISTITEYGIRKLAVKKKSGWGVQLLYYENDVLINTIDQSLEIGSYPETSPYIFSDFTFIVNHETHLASLIDLEYNSSTGTLTIGTRSSLINSELWYNRLMDLTPPVYSWFAWDQLAGNNGQYRNNITKIKHDSIGDISGANYGTDSDMLRITQLSDVVPYVRNMNYNSPAKIAYSGVNWLTAEIQADSGLLTNQVKCVFKFYIKNVSETTPFYTLTEYFFAGADDHHYLSFIHDDEQQAAAFLPVGYSRSTPQSPYYWGNVSPSENEMNLLWLWLQASGTPAPDPQPSGPYDNGSTDNGGIGGNPIPQDDIHTPNVPALGAMASGMFTVYCPNDTQLGQIAQYLWSDNFIDNVKKYFNNVSDNIIAFYVLPLEPENLPTKNFKIGNLENASITGVKYLNSRFISVDMGSVTVESRWDTYLDFSPFTRFNCYLPGVGIVALDSDDIMAPANQDGTLPTLTGSTISLTYVIDLFTGVLVAYVKINDQIRYQFPGRMGYSIPLTGQNYTAMGQGFVTAMAGLASTIATGGTAAPFTAGATAAGIVNAMKPDVYRGGNLSGDASMLSLKTPILIRTRPNKPAIENQELFSGAPSYKIDTIGNFGGFTQVAEAHIEGISCTDAERSEIMQLLRNGVLI